MRERSEPETGRPRTGRPETGHHETGRHEAGRPEVGRHEAERVLYRRLLELGEAEDLPPLLRAALHAIVEATGASRGYLQLDERGDDDRPRWWIGQGFGDPEAAAEEVRAHLSVGIIAASLAEGAPIQTASALRDPRFAARHSVRANAISAVLCAPIGQLRPLGVLYLAADDAPFDEAATQLALLFGRHLSPLVDRLLARAPDPTQALRRNLRADGLLGRSPALAAVLQQVEMVARVDITALLSGPSGAGKSRVARLIHDNSPRRSGPFVELNCATLPDSLLESELFGAEQGAHSTATRTVRGKVEAAQGGTLFLDEIGELPLAGQAKLLQLLQDKAYYRLGSSRLRRADIRLIAASHVDLPAAVEERRFRADLYYRLSVLPIRIPSLAERREDIGLLADHFCQRSCAELGLPALELSPLAGEALRLAAWPGNIRQLAHSVQAGLLRAAHEGCQRIEPRHLFPQRAGDADEPGGESFQAATLRFQRALLHRTLDAVDWNISEAARRLDLTRSYVHRLIRTHGLRRVG